LPAALHFRKWEGAKASFSDQTVPYWTLSAMGAGKGMIVRYSVSKNHDDWPYEKRWHHADKKDGLEKISFVPGISPNFHDGFGFESMCRWNNQGT
jgi:hypothetical protein